MQAALPDRAIHGLVFGQVIRPESRLDERVGDLAEELGLADTIHLMGFRDPIAAYMAGVDVTLVTALNEPFGRTLIEAMHLGTPVMATDHGGNPEAIDDGVNGFLVAPDAPEAFVTPVVELLQNDERRRGIVAAARQGIDERYGEARHIKEISAIYDALLAG
jgi:glycosyltransferase involved in cell wall biosynthesis